MSEDQAMRKLVLFGIVWPILTIIAIVGSILNILVLRQRSLRSSTTVYLLFLSINFLCQSLCRALRVTQGYPKLMENYNFKKVYVTYNLYIRYTVGNILVCSCNWLIVAMAVERCVVVGCVFKARRICTRRNAYIVCLIIFLASIIANVPRYFEYVPNYDRNTTQTANSGPLANKDAYTYFSIVFVTFLPFSAMLPISVLIVVLLTCHMRKLRSLNANVRGSSGSSSGITSRHQAADRSMDHRMEANHRSITILVIASNSLYFLCYALSVYIYFETARYPRDATLKRKSLRDLAEISDCLILVNTSFSALLYCCCSSVYRREAKALLRRCCCCGDSGPAAAGFRPVTVVSHSQDRSKLQYDNGMALASARKHQANRHDSVTQSEQFGKTIPDDTE